MQGLLPNTEHGRHVISSCTASAGFLSPAEKAGVRVRGSPYTYRAQTYERGEMHVGGIHREHRIAMAQQRQLGTNAERCRAMLTMSGNFTESADICFSSSFPNPKTNIFCVRGGRQNAQQPSLPVQTDRFYLCVLQKVRWQASIHPLFWADFTSM